MIKPHSHNVTLEKKVSFIWSLIELKILQLKLPAKMYAIQRNSINS